MERATLPSRSGFMKQVQFERNKAKSKHTFYAYKVGFRTMWRTCPSYLIRIGMKPPGEYRETNQMGGVMFSLPGEVDLTPRQAAQILWKCYQSGDPWLTYPQLRTIMKTLSFAYQVQGGEATGQFSTVQAVWDACQVANMSPNQETLKADPSRTPLPEEIREAFGQDWRPECGVGLVQWSVGQLAAWDWCVLGCRPNEDLGRLKKSEKHDICGAEGWGWTDFVGGRCKLSGKKRNNRPWKAWRVCLCANKKHIPVPDDVEYETWNNGFPSEMPTWHTGCPLAAMELVLRKQYPLYLKDEREVKWKGRVYRKWSNVTNSFTKNNEGCPVGLAQTWLYVQGVTRPFDTNSGRKSLGRWTLKLNCVYRDIFEVMGDLEDVWRKNYCGLLEELINHTGPSVGLKIFNKLLLHCPKLPKDEFKGREQSEDPDEACRVLRTLATWLKRGPRVKPRLTQDQKLQVALLKALGKKKKGEEALVEHPKFRRRRRVVELLGSGP